MRSVSVARSRSGRRFKFGTSVSCVRDSSSDSSVSKIAPRPSGVVTGPDSAVNLPNGLSCVQIYSATAARIDFARRNLRECFCKLIVND